MQCKSVTQCSNHTCLRTEQFPKIIFWTKILRIDSISSSRFFELKQIFEVEQSCCKYKGCQHNNPGYTDKLLKFYLAHTHWDGVESHTKSREMTRPHGSSAKQKVTQTYMTDIGEVFNLSQFLWIGELQPYQRQLRIFTL